MLKFYVFGSGQKMDSAKMLVFNQDSDPYIWFIIVLLNKQCAINICWSTVQYSAPTISYIAPLKMLNLAQKICARFADIVFSCKMFSSFVFFRRLLSGQMDSGKFSTRRGRTKFDKKGNKRFSNFPFLSNCCLLRLFNFRPSADLTSGAF